MQSSHNSVERRFTIKDGVRAPITCRKRIFKVLRRNSQAARERLGWVSKILHELGVPLRVFYKWLFVNESATPTIYFLFFVTTIYLVIESAFAAWLIDVMATHSDQSTIQTAEHYGRLISGFAIALLFWPWILKRKSWFKRILLLTVGTFFIMGLVYNVERRLINYLIDDSDAQSRAAANVGWLLRSALVTEQVKNNMFNGMWDANTAQTSLGKAFAGFSTFLVARSESARIQTLSIAPQVIRGVIEAQTGGVKVELSRYTHSQDAIRKQFERYDALNKRYKAALDQAGPYAQSKWEQYLSELKNKNRNWGKGYKSHDGNLVPKFAVERTRNAVREKGVPVPKNWNTGDRETFVALVRKQHEKKALDALEAQLKGIPKGLGLTAFANHSSIQNSWREMLGYPQSLGILSISKLSEDQFRKQVYDPTIAHRAKTLLTSYRSDVEEYGDGRVHAEVGRKAYEAMIAPVFALTLSLLGALVHFCKVVFFGIHAVLGYKFRHSGTKTIAIFFIVLISLIGSSLFVTTPLTSHRTYRDWIQLDPESSLNKSVLISEIAVGMALDSVIKGQSLMYPIFSFLRSGLAPLVDSAYGDILLSLLDQRNLSSR